MRILAPISLGELIDKITILEIKLKEVEQPEQRHNIRVEYDQLTNLIKEQSCYEDRRLNNLWLELLEVNQSLWRLEDQIRIIMNDEQYDLGMFASVGNRIHKTNDRRATIKKQINLEFNSDIIEEKIFTGRTI